MTSWIEGNRAFFFASQASLLTTDVETAAWYSPQVMHNAAYSWVVGRFVEADRANSNRQLFSLAGLQMARPTITHAPMNMSHDTRRIVGSFVASELMYPTGEQTAAVEGENGPFPCPGCGQQIDPADLPEDLEPDTCPWCGESYPQRDYPDSNNIPMMGSSELNPYIEALGVFWRHYFPEEYQLVQAAHQQGSLFYSMECVPSQIGCVGDGGCGAQFEYAGRQSPSYCDHLNKGMSDKYLIDPHFTAGAILVPPVKPGWSNADVHSLVSQHSDFADRLYAGIAADAPHLNKSEWEATMAELLTLASV